MLLIERFTVPQQYSGDYTALGAAEVLATPRSKTLHLQQRLRETGRNFPLRYAGLALVWAALASQSLMLTEQPTGTGAVCPANTWLPRPGIAPHLLVRWLDSTALWIVGRTLRRQQRQQQQTEQAEAAKTITAPSSNWGGVAAQLLLAALIMILLLVLSAPFSATSLRELVGHPAGLVVSHLFRDSILATAVLLSGACLLAHMTPSTLTLLGSGVGLASYHIFKMAEEYDTIRFPVRTSLVPPAVGVLAVVCIALLRDEALRFDAEVLGLAHPDPKLRRRLTACLVIFSAALQLTYTWSSLTSTHSHLKNNNNNSKANTFGNNVISLIQSAQRASDAWTSQARISHQLPEAVAEYKRRYGLPPPPGFDKWYAFATAHNSPVIDAFDQIHEDLLPFWGLPASVLRARTGHLLAQTNLGIGGLRIRNGSWSGARQISPGTPGTHRWMMEAYGLMIEPFVQSLPDMDLVFNIDDEPRVVVPAEALFMQHIEPGRRARARLAGSRANGHPLRPYFSDAADPPWEEDAFLDMEHRAAKENAHKPSEQFSARPRLPIYDTFIAPTCPPNSAAQRRRWWDGTRTLPEARGGVISSVPDLCDRPDLARMHGFLLSPGAFAVTQQVMPIFSQSRADGFNDILVPSPWNFVEKVGLDETQDREWKDKQDTVFWRGSASDGYSRGNTWPGFTRTRLVNLANRALWGRSTATVSHGGSSSNNDTVLTTVNPAVVDVSFVNGFTRCDTSDCRAETRTFYSAAASSSSWPPPAVDFQDHWANQHLLDVDGAGFSGRFLPFLRSKSAVYRATLFRTWYDERVHPWRHYIPVDVSLSGLWDLIHFVRGHVVTGREEVAAGHVDGMEGQLDQEKTSLAESVAADGREWARKALRKEDMQVYMFRLLLEWGRLVDDAREELGYDA